MSACRVNRRRVQRKAFRAEIDAFYVSALPNVLYLTGFSGSAAHLLLQPDGATLFVDGRYEAQAAAQTSGIHVVVSLDDPFEAMLEALRRRKLRRLGVERNRLSYVIYERLRSAQKKIVPFDGLVEQFRAVKSLDEIAKIRRSAALNSEVFEAVTGRLRRSWSEERLAGELEYEMRLRGATGASFPSIVASGAHGALPHAAPRPVLIERRSLVVVDHGAILDGYASDMTRMIALGAPPPEQRRLVDAVREAQEAAIAGVRAGVSCATVDRMARSVLKKRGLDRFFVHSTGHGLGLEIHEEPRIGRNVRARLKTGMTITIEPGVYVEGVGGVRIEDVVAVQADGCELLTRCDRELRIL